MKVWYLIVLIPVLCGLSYFVFIFANGEMPHHAAFSSGSSLFAKVPGPEVIKLSIVNSAEHGIYPAHKC